MDWYPWFPLDFRRDTYRLSLAEDGAYRRLLDEYMLLRGPLPNDDGALARMVGIGVDEWLAVASAVRPYFKVRGDKLTHKRCDQEIAAQNKRAARYSERGQKAAFARYSKINGMPTSSKLAHATRHNIDKTTTFSVAAKRVGDEAKRLEATPALVALLSRAQGER